MAFVLKQTPSDDSAPAEQASAADAPAPTKSRFVLKGSATQPAAPIPAATNSAPDLRSTPGYAAVRQEAIKSQLPEPLEAIARGGTFNYSDELYGNSAALQTAIFNPILKAIGVAPQWSPEEAKLAAQDVAREKADEFMKKRPVTNLAAEITGGAWMPFKSIDKGMEALGIGSKTLRAILSGSVAGAGAARGASDADTAAGRDAATLQGAGAGGVNGAILRGAAPVIGLAGKPLAGAVSEALERLATSLGRAPNGELSPKAIEAGTKRGQQYIYDLVRQVDPTRTKLAGNNLESVGLPQTAAEALGREAQTQLKLFGRRSGETPDALENMLTQRAEGMPAEMVHNIADAFGIHSDDVSGDFTRMMDALRQKAAPYYAKAYEKGPIMSDTLREIMSTPAGRRAVANAVEIAANARRNPFELGFRRFANAAPEDQAFMDPEGMPYFTLESPTMETWDFIKRGLDRVLTKEYRNPLTGRLDFKGRPEGRDILKLATDLRDELVRLNPDYGDALFHGGEPIRMEEAFGSAKRLLNANTTFNNFRSAVDVMGPAGKKALLAGELSRLDQLVATGKLNLKQISTDDYAAKLHYLGANDVPALINKLKGAIKLKQSGQRLMPGFGSDTSETLLADTEYRNKMRATRSALAALGQGKFGSAIYNLVFHPVQGALEGARAPIDRAARDEAGRLLMLRPSDLLKQIEDIERNQSIMQKTTRAIKDNLGVPVRNSVAARSGAATQSNKPERR